MPTYTCSMTTCFSHYPKSKLLPPSQYVHLYILHNTLYTLLITNKVMALLVTCYLCFCRGGRFTVIDHAPVSELRAENCRVKLYSLQKNVFRLYMTQKALLLRAETQWVCTLWEGEKSLKYAKYVCTETYVISDSDINNQAFLLTLKTEQQFFFTLRCSATFNVILIRNLKSCRQQTFAPSYSSMSS